MVCSFSFFAEEHVLGFWSGLKSLSVCVCVCEWICTWIHLMCVSLSGAASSWTASVTVIFPVSCLFSVLYAFIVCLLFWSAVISLCYLSSVSGLNYSAESNKGNWFDLLLWQSWRLQLYFLQIVPSCLWNTEILWCDRQLQIIPVAQLSRQPGGKYELRRDFKEILKQSL